MSERKELSVRYFVSELWEMRNGWERTGAILERHQITTLLKDRLGQFIEIRQQDDESYLHIDFDGLEDLLAGEQK